MQNSIPKAETADTASIGTKQMLAAGFSYGEIRTTIIQTWNADPRQLRKYGKTKVYKYIGKSCNSFNRHFENGKLYVVVEYKMGHYWNHVTTDDTGQRVLVSNNWLRDSWKLVKTCR